jgi:hypothetical protein
MGQLSEAEVALLLAVQAERVGFSRGRYFLLEGGQPDVPQEFFALRARGLVVLRRAVRGQRIPPTQLCDITPKAEALLKELTNA